MYTLVCMADFVVCPIIWTLVQAVGYDKVETQSSPITLQGAGLFHIAMGAILGIAAYGRTQEKLGDKAGATAGVPSFSTSPSFGNAPLGGNSMSTVPSFSPAPPPAFGGSKAVAPPPASQPEL